MSDGGAYSPFGEQLRKSVFSFKKRIINLDNSLVHGIVNSASPLFSQIWAWWSDILNTYLVHICVGIITGYFFYRFVH